MTPERAALLSELRELDGRPASTRLLAEQVCDPYRSWDYPRIYAGLVVLEREGLIVRERRDDGRVAWRIA